MGFFFRKSVNTGPVRINLSKSGVGVSTGVRGARVSFTPRGTFVNIGAHGVYYRRRLDMPTDPQSQRPSENNEEQSEPIDGSPWLASEIETAGAQQFVDESSEEFLSELNAKAHATAYAPFVWFIGIAAGILLFATISPPISAILAVACGVVTFAVSLPISKRDTLRRTMPIFYELDANATARFERARRACINLASCERLWRVNSTQPNWDWKRNAGASSLITRIAANAGQLRAPHISTNVEVCGIELGNMKLLFLPDWILVYERGTYGAISYESISVESSKTQFIEEERVPTDCSIVGHVWKFVRRDGGPDRRFNNNWEIPIVVYGMLELTSSTGLNIHLHGSSVERCASFATALSGVASSRFDSPEPYHNSNSSQPSTGMGNAALTAFGILGLEEGASAAEIKVAYHRMVQMYHPDKVATLAPDFQELAHRRMTEINNAYSVLKGRNAPVADKPPEPSEQAPITFWCPYCKKSLRVPRGFAGKIGKCPNCQRKVKAPQV